jgi:hypothetical protein
MIRSRVRDSERGMVMWAQEEARHLQRAWWVVERERRLLQRYVEQLAHDEAAVVSLAPVQADLERLEATAAQAWERYQRALTSLPETQLAPLQAH